MESSLLIRDPGSFRDTDQKDITCDFSLHHSSWNWAQLLCQGSNVKITIALKRYLSIFKTSIKKHLMYDNVTASNIHLLPVKTLVV